MSEQEIVWEDPPRIEQYSSSWRALLAPLLERPGEWARVAERSPASASNVINALRNRRCNVPRPDDEWSFVRRTTGGRTYVYARYLGPSKDGESA